MSGSNQEAYMIKVLTKLTLQASGTMILLRPGFASTQIEYRFGVMNYVQALQSELEHSLLKNLYLTRTKLNEGRYNYFLYRQITRLSLCMRTIPPISRNTYPINTSFRKKSIEEKTGRSEGYSASTFVY